MKIIKNGNPNISKLIGEKSINRELFYRLSAFAYVFSNVERHFIQYTLTGMVVEFWDDEWHLISQLKEHKVRGDELQEKYLLDLASKQIIVECDFDDYKQYEWIVYMLKTIVKKNNGVKTYTILPTTGCNARCAYCYEEGMQIETMNVETTNNVIDFIDKTKHSDEISIIWFGGEPLTAEHVISYICARLNEKNIKFHSKIVTNASLFTEELVVEAKNLWHLKSAQVSVDGNRRDYERIKRYRNPNKYNYETMMSAISYLLNEGIDVAIRCNYDSKNLNGMREFLEDVESRFKNPPNLSVYFSMYFQERDNEHSVDLHKKSMELLQYFYKRGMKSDVFPEKVYRFKTNLCMANSDGRGIVIAPNGDLYNCEHLPGNSSFGNICDKEINIKSDLRAYISADEKCRKCCFLPYCTPFFKNGCPDWFKYCYEFKCAEMDCMLEQVIQDYYKASTQEHS